MDSATLFIIFSAAFFVLTICGLVMYKYCHSTEMIELAQKTSLLKSKSWNYAYESTEE